MREDLIKTKKSIILASASPRRKELLEKIGLQFMTDASDYPENADRDMEPAKLAITLSLEKALAVSSRYPDSLIIAADTFGVLRGKIIGKPHTPEEARKMLKAISGKSHRVITGLTVMDTSSRKTISRSVETRVFIKKLTDSEIDGYVKTGEPLDKAGAYAIQGLGAIIVEKIYGDYYNVVGLPLKTLIEMLGEFGIHLF